MLTLFLSVLLHSHILAVVRWLQFNGAAAATAVKPPSSQSGGHVNERVQAFFDEPAHA